MADDLKKKKMMNKADDIKQETGEEAANFINFDDVLDHVGTLSKFPMRTFVPLCIAHIFPGIIAVCLPLVGIIPDYRCFVAGCDDEDNPEYGAEWFASSGGQKNMTEGNSVPWRCRRFNSTWTGSNECDISAQRDTSGLAHCDRYIYDKSVVGSSIVTEFQLTCEEEWKQVLANTIFMIGKIFSSILVGAVADVYGRKKAHTIVYVLQACLFIGSSQTTNYVTYVIVRFFRGLTTGMYSANLIWALENVGSRYRVKATFAIETMYSLGGCIIVFVAYLARDWRVIELFCGAPLLIFISYYWLIPESTRWLISQKRFDEAHKQIAQACKLSNKEVISPYKLQSLSSNGSTLTIDTMISEMDSVAYAISVESVESAQVSMRDTPEPAKIENLLDILRSWLMVKRLVIMSLTWIAVYVVFYGVALSVANFSQGVYMSLGLLSLTEMISNIIGIFIVDYFGNRTILLASFNVCGLVFIAAGLLPLEYFWSAIFLTMIGKLTASFAFAMTYVYTAELFPTSARGSASGVCLTFGIIGGVLAPAVASSGRYVSERFPLILMGIPTLLAGLLMLLLPETKGTKMPNSIAEARELEKSNAPLCCTTKQAVKE